MSKNMEVLKQRLFGYQKKQVNQFIDEIDISHQKAISLLQDKIKNYLQEKERLLKEIAMLKSIDQSNEEEAALMEIALKRASKTIAVINKMAAEDIVKIIDHAKNEIMIHEKQAENLGANMEEKRVDIDKLLIRVRLLLSEEEKVENIPDKDRTQATKGDRFWEDWDESSLKEIEPKELFSQGIKENEESAFRDEKKDVSIEERIEETQIETQINEVLTRKHQNSRNIDQKVQGKPFKDRKVVSQEIEKIRQRYMLGKITGADILDQKGNLIIPKNSVISPEIVKKAEKENKLVELILNMSFPEINE